LNIKFFYDRIKFRVRSSEEIKRFLVKVITEERKIPGDLNFIFTDDDMLLGINKEFLKHNYITDVIAFDNGDRNIVSGEVYLNIDAIRRNARLYHVKLREEILRVLIHGTLHLCGYLDMEDKEKEEMFGKQELLVKRFGK
jgi:rRNA maturation RNase YbeY